MSRENGQIPPGKCTCPYYPGYSSSSLSWVNNHIISISVPPKYQAGSTLVLSLYTRNIILGRNRSITTQDNHHPGSILVLPLYHRNIILGRNWPITNPGSSLPWVVIKINYDRGSYLKIRNGVIMTQDCHNPGSIPVTPVVCPPAPKDYLAAWENFRETLHQFNAWQHFYDY